MAGSGLVNARRLCNMPNRCHTCMQSYLSAKVGGYNWCKFSHRVPISF